MKIITFSAIKGGVGKTTLAYNYGEWLASKGKMVLFIDLDHQCNLTQTYDIFENYGTVADIFKAKGDVLIHSVKKNIDLIAGYIRLDKLEKELETKSYKDMLLYMWLEDHYVSMNLEKYDYIIIDCHPDFSTATRNAIIVSHAILSPIIPSEHGYQAKFNLSERLEEFKTEAFDFKTRESFVTAKLFFLGNMIKHNTNSSKELIRSLKNDKSVLAMIPHKELFNRSTLDKKSLSYMMSDKELYSRDSKFFKEIDFTFRKITDKL
ncbi:MULTISPECIES: ParA family protein [Streptococcus]|uniref:ParA family protein n=1 Tax=Streptococcus TaxID=1301 RepID=UPI0002B924CF|nr:MULTISPECIES: ParA family protein [Streptococcus]EPT38679.1 peptide transporter [Streptococcus agalactiae FSL C1-494]EPT46801.1 peptide transporter [Streptococcus agalactiae FSL S3-170]MCK1189887.1 ParA family protein [Streptococcus uberis]MCK1219350.1 ParA family protein [Streptococcus uberis]MCK1248678.1 ParA family protein [Streptococcus uberis]